MGNTFRLLRAGGVYAVESEFGDGRTLRFVARLLDGEAMTDVCRDFGVSRKTGYKIFDRYKEHGLPALSDRSRRPVRYANQLPQQVESLIVRLKGEKPHWGARKIRELLVRRLDGDVRVPAKSTIHAVLDRHGLVKRGDGPRWVSRAPGRTPSSSASTPRPCKRSAWHCGRETRGPPADDRDRGHARRIASHVAFNARAFRRGGRTRRSFGANLIIMGEREIARGITEHITRRL